MLHPIDTLKTRMQSQAIITGTQGQKTILQMVRTVWASDGLRGFYRGIAPGVTGSLATCATYFGVIESTKTWLEKVNPNLSSHWSHFIAGAIVIKQCMQVQGTRGSWISATNMQNAMTNCGLQRGYYSGMFQAGRSILKEHGLRGACILECNDVLRSYGSTNESSPEFINNQFMEVQLNMN